LTCAVPVQASSADRFLGFETDDDTSTLQQKTFNRSPDVRATVRQSSDPEIADLTRRDRDAADHEKAASDLRPSGLEQRVGASVSDPVSWRADSRPTKSRDSSRPGTCSRSSWPTPPCCAERANGRITTCKAERVSTALGGVGGPEAAARSADDEDRRGWAGSHYELDCIGNVRRLRAAFDSPPNAYGIDWTAGADFGGYRYTAFGQQYPSDTTTPHPAVVPGGDNQDYIQQPLGWQGHYRLPWSDSHEELYDFRTRIWSPRLGAFLQPDGFGYITPTGTLWSWPGQNPMRWRDPYGNFGWEDVESGILVHGESIQNGFLLASGLAASVGLAAVAGPLLGLGTLEGALGTAGTAALGLGRAAAASAAGAGAALLRGAKGCSTDGARGALRFGANDLVYGPSARGALRQLQQSAGGKLLTDVGGPAAGQSWPQFSIQMLQRQLAAGGRIRFDLTHMQDIPGALRGTGQFGNTITAAELRFLQQHWSQFGAITTFYRNGVEAAAPW
jgi:RHS repeat-associated protein